MRRSCGSGRPCDIALHPCHPGRACVAGLGRLACAWRAVCVAVVLLLPARPLAVRPPPPPLARCGEDLFKAARPPHTRTPASPTSPARAKRAFLSALVRRRFLQVSPPDDASSASPSAFPRLEHLRQDGIQVQPHPQDLHRLRHPLCPAHLRCHPDWWHCRAGSVRPEQHLSSLHLQLPARYQHPLPLHCHFSLLLVRCCHRRHRHHPLACAWRWLSVLPLPQRVPSRPCHLGLLCHLDHLLDPPARRFLGRQRRYSHHLWLPRAVRHLVRRHLCWRLLRGHRSDLHQEPDHRLRRHRCRLVRSDCLDCLHRH